MENKIYVIGGSGYIGTPLCRELRADGWEVENIDCRVYGDRDKKQDVRTIKPPGDGSPCIFLATIHREPAGLTAKEQGAWGKAMEDLMVNAPLNWLRAGHPLTFASSMQVPKGGCLYANAKLAAEQRLVGLPNCDVLRFGTAWGQMLDGDPVRFETAINSALTGKELTENYVAHVTHISLIVQALAYAPCCPQYGEVRNVTDMHDPITGRMINCIPDIEVNKHTPFQALFMQEYKKFAQYRELETFEREHFTKSLANYYGLPWPKDLSEIWSKDSPIIQEKKS